MDGKQGNKLVIPTRQYEAPIVNTQVSNAPGLNIGSTFEEVKKGPTRQLNKKKKNKNVNIKDKIEAFKVPLPSEKPVRAELDNEKISKINEKFNIMRENAKAKSKKNITSLTEEYNKNLTLLEKDLENEISELDQLEKFFIEQFTEIPKKSVFTKENNINQEIISKDVVAKELESIKPIKDETNTHELSKFSINKIPPRPYGAVQSVEPLEDNIKHTPIILNSQNIVLYNHSCSNLHISKDLENIEILDLSENFLEGSNLMALSSNKVLIALSTGSVYILNTLENSIKNGPNFKAKRKYFAMSYIKGWPSILGGLDDYGNSLTIVETLNLLENNYEWSFFSNMNEPRSRFQSIKCKKRTYVFGGFNNNTFLASIEEYFNTWKTLPIKMPVPLINFGLVLKESDIFIFGGLNEFGHVKKALCFNTNNKNFKIEYTLPFEYYTENSGSVRLIGEVFFIFDLESMKIIKYIP